MGTITFRNSGTTATLRGAGIKIFWVYPTIVVEDNADLIALYMPAGVMGKNVSHRPTIEEMLTPENIEVVDHQWLRTDVLFLIKPEDAFCVYMMRDAQTKELDCWYINLQEPIRRTAIGFDTMDQMLDVVVSSDMDTWEWKDQDELAAAEKAGIYSKEEAQKIRLEAERAINLVLVENRSFYEQWQDWQPSPQWGLPEPHIEWQNMSST